MLGKETQKSHERRTESGFYDKYMSGNGIDVGFCGYNHAAKIQPVLPTAIGVELDFFKKDGQIFRWKEGQYKDTKVLPWPDNSLDYVFSSHVLEHIDDYKSALQD